MKKIIAVILLLLMIASPCYAINMLEKVLLKRDTIKRWDAKILVNPLTHKIKYIWWRNPSGGGSWKPLDESAKEQYQAIYDLQDKKD
jgi:hypothetical protein